MNTHSVQAARRRAIMAFGALALGIVLARSPIALAHGEISSVDLLAVACALVALSIPAGGRFKSALLLLGIVALGAGWTRLRTSETAPDRLDRLAAIDGSRAARSPIEIRGVVLDEITRRFNPARPGDPPMWARSRLESRIRVEAVYLSDAQGRGTWAAAGGRARLILPEEPGASRGVQGAWAGSIHAGDRVEVLGLYEPPGGARNPGERDWSALSAQSGRVGSLVVDDPSMVRVVGAPGGVARLGGWVLRGRAAIRGRALGALGLGGADESRQRAMLGALLLGERDAGFEGVYESFQRVGVAHVLAISGFHLALVILVCAVLIRCAGEHPRTETAIILTILALTMLLIPLRPPIMRAGIIVAALLGAGSLGRRYDRMTILAYVGAGLLVWRPLDAFSLGYQLSVGVTALLVVLSDEQQRTRARRREAVLGFGRPRAPAWRRLGRWIGTIAGANFACWIAAAPAIAYHAGLVSLLSPIVSLALIPMIVVLMIAGYLQIALGIIAPALAARTIPLIDGMALGVDRFVGAIDTIPLSSVRLGRVGVAWTLGATLVLALLAAGRIRWRSRTAAVLLAVVIAWPAVAHALRGREALLRIDMLDVGDGSCLIVRSGGRSLLWDCGSLDRRVGRGAADASRALGAAPIGDMVITHDNLDHFNGVLDLAPRVGLRRVWITPQMRDDPSPAWTLIARRLAAQGIEIRTIQRGVEIPLGSAALTCLWPDAARIGGLSDNDASAVVRIDVPIEGGRARTALLCGDIESAAMDALLDADPGLRADVLELPHHGSAKPGAPGFVRRIDPGVVLQSTGVGRLGDPRWDGVRTGRAWMTTAEGGAIFVGINTRGEIEYGWDVRGRR